MATQTNEPRALSAALSSPAMTTRAGGLAMHVADRHVERWAPEATADKSRPLRNLGFVDRTIAPWIETAQRSASLRLFSQYRAEGMGERQPGNVSWVFPRPWYQDELDWMAAARQQPMELPQQAMLTTRGTYVPTTSSSTASQPAPAALPAALYEYIAPSLSIAQPTTEARGIGYGGNDAYSPLVSLAAVQAAEVMQRAVAPQMMAPTTRTQPALRNVLQAMLERAALAQPAEPSRISMQAPELVTPPAPRAEGVGSRGVSPSQSQSQIEAMQLAERYAEQRAQIAEVQRVARVAAEREMAARIEAARQQAAAETTVSSTQATPALRDASARSEAELRQRIESTTASNIDAARAEAERAERVRIEERRLAERGASDRTVEQQAEQQRAVEAQRGEQQRTVEAQRSEQLRAVEAQRTEQQRAEVQRSEQQRAEAQRTAQRAEAQRTEQQRADAQRADAQRAEQLRAGEQRTVEQQRTEQQRTEQQRVEQQRVEQQRIAELRADQQRTAEQRTAEQHTAEQRTAEQRTAEQRTAALRAEQHRGEQQQRAEQQRTSARLHEQSRADAAAHARAAAFAPASEAEPVASQSRRADAPAEVAAAIASLPPELQAFISQPRDGGSINPMQAIDELNNALRSVELISRAAASGTSFESSRGPRLMIPAGLGGLVSAIDRAQPTAVGQPQRPQLAPLRLAGDANAQAMGIAPPVATPAARAAQTALRVPAMHFLSAPTARTMDGAPSRGPTNALEAATAANPAALAHVAWADRWLARFAGASQHSLDTLAVAGAFERSTRMQALSAAAPDSVFVSPTFDIERGGETVRFDSSGHAIVTSPRAAAAPTMSIVAPTFAQATGSQATGSQATGSQATGSQAIGSQATGSQASSSSSDVPGPRLIERMPDAIRYDDNAETPDDVFEAIAAGVTRTRSQQASTSTSTASSSTPITPTLTSVPATPAAPHVDRFTAADAVAHAAPTAPGAGFAAQLASSPFAPALRHVLPLPTAPSFDVRSLFGGGLSATYLAGLLAATSDAVTTSSMVPAWAQWSPQAAWSPQAQAGIGIADCVEGLTREVASFDPTYVAPDAADGFEAGRGAEMRDAAVEAAVRDAEMRGAELRGEDTSVAAPAAQLRAELEAQATQLTTLRSQLLSWTVEQTPSGQTFVPAADAAAPTVVTRTSSPMSTATARTMLETMSLPMLGDGSSATELPSEEGAAWTAPGMVADRAHSWSVAQERSSADLSFDFVPPELVLAARVYGLGPAEAAQAARLALAGPGHLSAMAGAVDRTFVQAMTMEAERRERITTAYPSSSGDVIATRAPMAMPVVAPPALPALPALALGDASGDATPASIASATSASTASLAASTGTAFGVDRKVPRGAFLWPAGTVAALGLTAAAPDGQQSMSIAALELLAAQAVAELGTYTALSERETDDAIDVSSTESGVAAMRSDAAAPRALPMPIGPQAMLPQGAQGQSSEPAEADVLASAGALVPAARRARFDALYVALSQSSSSASWSPAARAARALALAGRGAQGEDGPVTARERAAFAWDVLPVVYADAVAAYGADKAALAFGEQGSTAAVVTASDGTLVSERRQRGAIDRRSIGGREYVAADDISVDGRPGLGALSARAGEALGSYVAPTSATAPFASSASSSTSSSTSSNSSSSAPRELGAVLRAPSAAQELVRTGSGRHGGGETEIPAWFEKAARKMLEDRSAPSDGISMAELTLVTAAPASHVAASSRTAPSANPITAGANSQAASSQAGAADIDVEKIANEIYRHILVMMDIARARNGEPYL